MFYIEEQIARGAATEGRTVEEIIQPKIEELVGPEAKEFD